MTSTTTLADRIKVYPDVWGTFEDTMRHMAFAGVDLSSKTATGWDYWKTLNDFLTNVGLPDPFANTEGPRPECTDDRPLYLRIEDVLPGPASVGIKSGLRALQALELALFINDPELAHDYNNAVCDYMQYGLGLPNREESEGNPLMGESGLEQLLALLGIAGIADDPAA